jgi:hypothetical protein
MQDSTEPPARVDARCRELARHFALAACTLAVAIASSSALTPSAQSAQSSSGSAATAPRAPSVVLPDGPVARAFASSPSTGARVAFATLCPPGIDATFVPANAWQRASTWILWAQEMTLAANREKRELEPRAGLALLALANGRWSDAWFHFRACDASKEWMSALLPSFLPGVPRLTKLDSDRSPPLRDGAELRPSLPPPSDHAIEGHIDVRSMTIESFVVGDATLSMRVGVEVEGVQIDIDHRAGGEAHLSIVIPEPDELAIGNEYVDWMVQPTHHEPLALVVKPGDEAHTIYGRFESRSLSHPTHVAERVPAQISAGILWLLVPDEPADREFFDAVAKSVRALPLAIDCRVITSRGYSTSKHDASDTALGTTIDLRSREERDEKLKWLVSSLEHLVLAARQR